MITHLISGLVIGALGSAHCLGMCGPLALSIPLPQADKKGGAIFLCQLGKTAAYISLGLVIGAIGAGFSFFKWQQVFSIIIGGLMLLFVFKHYVLKRHVNLKLPYARAVQNQLSLWMNKPNHSYKYPVMGYLNGLLPCGLVYIALGAAGLAGSMQSAAVLMLGFGLGTAPAPHTVGEETNGECYSLKTNSSFGAVHF